MHNDTNIATIHIGPVMLRIYSWY